jgi:hypothetical protein
VSLLVLRYSVLRLALFAAVLGVLWLVGARGILLVGLAAVVSFALSYLLLRRQRDAVAAAISSRVEARPHHAGGVDEAFEDAADEASRARLGAAQSAEAQQIMPDAEPPSARRAPRRDHAG